MNVTLDIPDEIMATLPTAPRERNARLLLELAVALYAKGAVSLSQGAAMAGVSRMEFGVEVGERGIPRHYGEDELAEDLAHAGRQSDTSPVSNLAIIGRLDLLRRLYGEVIIPPVVAEELSQLYLAEGRAAVSAAFTDGWLRIVPPAAVSSPIPQLDAGETESIALALSEPGTLLLMDEAEGRAAARGRGIALTGAVGVLIAARRKNWIPALKPELLALRSKARFFLAAKFFSDALNAVGETV